MGLPVCMSIRSLFNQVINFTHSLTHSTMHRYQADTQPDYVTYDSNVAYL